MYNINEILNNFKEFPAMPNVVMQALNIMKNPDSSLKELGKIISYDQSLSTKVLTIVNSAYYGFSQQITSIPRAISLLGMSKTKNIIITVAMKPMLTNQGDKNLWKHCISTAVGCEYLANYLKIMDPDEAFVIGFLHDLGKVILKMKDGTLYQKAIDLLEYQPNSNILDIEQSYFGVNHCQTGSLLVTRWKLPLLVNNAVKYHHTPNLSSIPIPCTVVYCVDKLVKDNFSPDDLNPEFMSNLNIQIEQPDILKNTIISKAQILLQELA